MHRLPLEDSILIRGCRALRVLTGYSSIEGQDMAAEAPRPHQTSGRDMVGAANEYLVPEGIAAGLWERSSGPERIYLHVAHRAVGVKKLEDYRNFAKAFRFGGYLAAMASTKPNNTRLNGVGSEAHRLRGYRRSDQSSAGSGTRVSQPGDDLMALAAAIASGRKVKAPAEAEAARILQTRIKDERLGRDGPVNV